MSRRKGKGTPRSRAPKVQSRKRPAPTPRKPGVYVPTNVTPEELFQAIGRLRKDARDEIDRLIRFLDETDNHMEREPEDEADDGDLEDGADEEDSLGSLERHASIYGPDGKNATGSQLNWAGGRGDDLEDEHDGAEPDDNEGGDGAREDDEPNLGWTLNGQGGGTSAEGDDCEVGGSVGAEDQTHWVGSGGHDTGMAPAAMRAIRSRYKRFDRHVTNADGKHVDTEGDTVASSGFEISPIVRKRS